MPALSARVQQVAGARRERTRQTGIPFVKQHPLYLLIRAKCRWDRPRSFLLAQIVGTHRHWYVERTIYLPAGAHSGHLVSSHTAGILAYPSTTPCKSPTFHHFNTSHKVVASEQTWSLHECDGLSEEELSVNTAECERVGLGRLGTIRPAAPVLAECSGSQRTHKERHLYTQWVRILSSSSRIRHCNRKPRGSAPGCAAYAALTPAQTHSLRRRLRNALHWLHSEVGDRHAQTVAAAGMKSPASRRIEHACVPAEGRNAPQKCGTGLLLRQGTVPARRLLPPRVTRTGAFLSSLPNVPGESSSADH